jgi:hypothetical protein
MAVGVEVPASPVESVGESLGALPEDPPQAESKLRALRIRMNDACFFIKVTGQKARSLLLRDGPLFLLVI